MLGGQAIAATTYAVESVVLQHLKQQMGALEASDREAHDAIADIVEEEQTHHDHGQALIETGKFWPKVITPVVRISTETVIRLGMRL